MKLSIDLLLESISAAKKSAGLKPIPISSILARNVRRAKYGRRIRNRIDTNDTRPSAKYQHISGTSALIKAVAPHLYLNVTHSASFALLSKSGIRTLSDLLKSFEAFFSKATNEEAHRIANPDSVKKLWQLSREVYSVGINEKNPLISQASRAARYSANRAEARKLAEKVRNLKPEERVIYKPLLLEDAWPIFEGVSKFYLFFAERVCAALQKDFKTYGKGIAAYSMFGKAMGYKIPAGLANSLKTAQKQASANKNTEPVDDGLRIENLKLSHFKKGDAQLLVERLPALYSVYIKGDSEKTKKDKAAVSNKKKALRAEIANLRKEQKKYVLGTVKYRKITLQLRKIAHELAYKLSASALNNKVTSQATRTKKNKALFEKVGAELYSFFCLTIPALKKSNLNFDIDHAAIKKLETQKRKKTTSMRSVRYRGTPAQLKKVKEEIKQLSSKIKELKGNAGPEVKAWMAPYLGTSVSLKIEKGGGRRTVIDAGLLQHRLVTRANQGKVKAGDVELTTLLDKHNANLLTLKGISVIFSAFENNSVKLFKSLFKNVVDVMQPKLFTIEYSEASIVGLETDTGKVTNTRLLRLNNISVEEQAEIAKTYAKEIAAWNPLKDDLRIYVKSLTKTKEAIEHHYKVQKSSAAQLKANRVLTKKFMSYMHNVKELKVLKSWEIKPSKKLEAVLANTKTSKSLKVIRNVFHGTSRQTGSIILARGFKIAGTKVTARAMGDVLYIAPNIDKSAQYMKTGGAFRAQGKVSGMIFMGDIIVSGEPKRNINGSRTGFAWTKLDSFKTEEIGLANPNSQFIIRKAMIVSMEKNGLRGPVRPRMGPRQRAALAPKSTAPKGAVAVTHFEAPIVLSSYKEQETTVAEKPKAKKPAVKITAAKKVSKKAKK